LAPVAVARPGREDETAGGGARAGGPAQSGFGGETGLLAFVGQQGLVGEIDDRQVRGQTLHIGAVEIGEGVGVSGHRSAFCSEWTWFSEASAARISSSGSGTPAVGVPCSCGYFSPLSGQTHAISRSEGSRHARTTAASTAAPLLPPSEIPVRRISR